MVEGAGLGGLPNMVRASSTVLSFLRVTGRSRMFRTAGTAGVFELALPGCVNRSTISSTVAGSPLDGAVLGLDRQGFLSRRQLQFGQFNAA